MAALTVLLLAIVGICGGFLLRIVRFPLEYVWIVITGLGIAGLARIAVSAPRAEAVMGQPILLTVPNLIVLAVMLASGVYLADNPRALIKLKNVRFDPVAELNKSAGMFEDVTLTFRTRQQRKRSRAGRIDLYYEAVLKFGALIAAADGKAEEREYEALKGAFAIDAQNIPNPRKLYQAQLNEPESMKEILRLLKVAYPPRSGAMETFVFGMCQVVRADGRVHDREVSLLRIAAESLGFSHFDTARIFLMAGLTEAPRERERAYAYEQGGGRPSHQRPEREEHLMTLGLKAGATPAEIKRAYRRLARKHHPDRLMSQGLSAAEMEKAEEIMVKLNAAYAALEA